MRRITGQIDIPRPIEEVFNFLADETNEPRYNDDMVRCQSSSVLEIVPEGRFVAYGVGVSLNDMRDPNKAYARLPVQAIGPLSTSEAVDA